MFVQLSDVFEDYLLALVHYVFHLSYGKAEFLSQRLEAHTVYKSPLEDLPIAFVMYILVYNP